MRICGGATSGYCEIGSEKIDITPASANTMQTTIAKRGRSMKNLENIIYFASFTAPLSPEVTISAPEVASSALLES